jgi:alkylhydroperoxidase family enzyme
MARVSLDPPWNLSNRLDAGLKDLAVIAAAASIRCSCVDLGYWESTTTRRVVAERIRAIPDWQDSEVFTGLERLVMLYAEAMTITPPLVTGDLVARLREHLAEAELVELTVIIAAENMRSRMDAALGPSAQGSEDSCDLPVGA